MKLIRHYSTFIFSIIVIGILVFGWQQRNEYWLMAEKGWGYALGIIGGSLMLLLLLYPLRKHWKLTRNWFSIRYWFKMHMLFGILGPLLILFHSNFHLGSLNSNIALFSMLLVSGSGLIGRYAYQKIHRGLYGAQIQFSELKQSFDKSRSHFRQSELLEDDVRKKLAEIEVKIIQRKIPFFVALFCHRQIKKTQVLVNGKSRQRAAQLLSDNKKLKEFTQETHNLLTGISRLKSMANYALYARVFSMWHIFHLPIFFMMLIAGIVHVFVVHIY